MYTYSHGVCPFFVDIVNVFFVQDVPEKETATQVERYGDVRSVLLYAEIRAVISLKWPVIRP